MPEANSSLNLNVLLQQQVRLAQDQDRATAAFNDSGAILEVPDTGKMVSTAYEQLRNVAEYSEEHLLLQRAIRRFCKRNLFLTKWHSKPLGTELIVELSQAGYLKTGQFAQATANRLDEIIAGYMEVHGRLRQAHVEREMADDWTLALISTQAESLLNPHNLRRATASVAYQHFLRALPRDKFTDMTDFSNYEACLYIAVEQAILKADVDTVRYELLQIYRQSTEDTSAFIHFNRQIDQLYNSSLTLRLRRLVSRYGAPFRALRGLLGSRRLDLANLVADRGLFLDAYDTQLAHEYRSLPGRLNRGLLKSILFLLITKALIGLGIEVPYDLIVRGAVARLPLTLNLLFPPLYMASLKLSLLPPSNSNKRAIHDYMEESLYGDTDMPINVPEQRRASVISRFVYAVLLAIPVVLTVLILQRVGFNVLQMVIFFVFFSTASFLGFRLGTMTRDWELTLRQPGLATSMRDFFYLPFIVSGQWISRKYSRINIVARFLDVAIELPLKSVLRLVRQWMNFLREIHDDLY
jgi:hypothetical protein